jgi:excisionase family DNA binding protein
MTTEPEAVYTVNDVAEVLGKTPKWVGAQARSGRLPSRKVGRSRRFTAQDIADYLESVREGVNPMARNARQIAARNRGRR